MADIAASIGATGTATVRRPRVASMLAAAWKRRTTLVVADGGYGKTTALREVAAAGESSWVTIRPSDGLIETLSARLAVALGAPPRTGRSGHALATSAADRRGPADGRPAPDAVPGGTAPAAHRPVRQAPAGTRAERRQGPRRGARGLGARPGLHAGRDQEPADSPARPARRADGGGMLVAHRRLGGRAPASRRPARAAARR